jgi:hypothetical protein
MGRLELALYRIGFMLMHHAIGYLANPARILRTIRNVFFSSSAATTVLEHRLKDLFKRKRAIQN